MSEVEEQGMKPIWHFVGLLMSIMGVLLIGAGIYYWYNPSQSDTVLRELHPNLWWGAIMLAFGAVLLWLNKGVTVEE